MEHLPIYIYIVFILTTALTALLLFKATNYSQSVIIATLLWLALHAVLSIAGFYKITTGTPPRFALLLIPPILFIVIRLFTKSGQAFKATFDIKTLTLLHIIRIPVELVLYWLFLYKGVPRLMTFEGRNFDILCGITAPIVYYWGFVKVTLGKAVIIGWNMICLLLLVNIVLSAILSAPFSFQKFGFDQPDIALLYFPFVWLPCLIVPAVLMAHLVTIKQLLKTR